MGIPGLTNSGASGRLVGVLRTVNSLGTTAGTPGSYAYSGNEYSDIHAAAAITKRVGKAK